MARYTGGALFVRNGNVLLATGNFSQDDVLIEGGQITSVAKSSME